jgi:hypothetical protein
MGSKRNRGGGTSISTQLVARFSLLMNLLISELRRDPRQPVGGPNFPIAARRALMLYVPFRQFEVLFDPQLIENPDRHPALYDMHDTAANNSNVS